jgi:amino acid transporter
MFRVELTAPDRHQSIGYVFAETVNNSGYGAVGDNFSILAFWFIFGLGLLMSQDTITGFDASAHLAEETREASRTAAVGMYMSVVAAVIFGWILLLAVTFSIPSTEGALENLGVVVPWIWAESMSQNWSEALLFICVVAQFFCVTASVTSASRTMFAFSRDRAVPGHQLLSQVARNRVPRNAVWAIVVLAGIPLYRAGLPWRDDFEWELTNYTILWFAAIGLVFGGWWALSAKKWFVGPVRQGDEAELERIERELAGRAPVTASEPNP